MKIGNTYMKSAIKDTLVHGYNGEHPLEVYLCDMGDGNAELTSGFLQCNVLNNWVNYGDVGYCQDLRQPKTPPDSITIIDEGKEITYTGIQWGEGRHTDSVEMSACHFIVKFTYQGVVRK